MSDLLLYDLADDVLSAAREWVAVAASEQDDGDAQFKFGQALDTLRVAATTLQAENAEMRAVVGPRCPKCGKFLKAEHHRSFNPPRNDIRYYRNWYSDECPTAGHHYAREIYVAEIRSDHPEIAKELGL